MKKKLIFLTALFCILAIPVQAFDMENSQSSGTSQSKIVQLKKLADEYVQIQLGESKGSTQKILKEMVTLGASDFKAMKYTPCPYRGTIKIAGKSINATNRECVEFKYTYKNKEYASGKCGEALR